MSHAFRAGSRCTGLTVRRGPAVQGVARERVIGNGQRAYTMTKEWYTIVIVSTDTIGTIGDSGRKGVRGRGRRVGRGETRGNGREGRVRLWEGLRAESASDTLEEIESSSPISISPELYEGRMKFLFWNVGDWKATNTELPRMVADLGAEYQPDLLMLFEAGNIWTQKQDVVDRTRKLAADLCQELSTSGKNTYVQVDNEVRGGLLLTSLPVKRVKPVLLEALHATDPDRRRLDAVHLAGADPEVLVFMVHAPSKLHATDLDQQLFFAKLRRVVRKAERDMKVRHSIIMGDMNADPFEPSIAGAPFLHAVMAKELFGRTNRSVRGRRFGKGFYNPMWSLLGDGTAGPSGTYFYRSSRAYQIYWHMFDQVLLRPGLVHPSDNRLGPIQILAKMPSGRNLAEEIMKGRHCKDPPQPDHLPVLFDLYI